MKYQEFFKGKKITLLGLGLLGRGVGDAKFLAKYAKELVVTDLKTEAELKASLKKLSKFKSVVFLFCSCARSPITHNRNGMAFFLRRGGCISWLA